MSQCKAHLCSNIAKWFAPLVAQLLHIEYHSQTICLLIQHACQPAPADRLSEEVQQVLSEVLCAYNSGGILAATETMDQIKDHLEVSQIGYRLS